MIKAHKTRINPTEEQAVYFRKACGTARFVYNYGLAEWKRHKSENRDTPFGPMALKKEFNAIKRERFPWVLEVAKDVAENAFFQLGAALSNFSASQQGKRKGKKVEFPKFKSKHSRKQAFHLNNDKVKVRDHELYVPCLGWVARRIAESLRFSGKIMSVTISRRADLWFVSITVEMEKIDKPKSTGRRTVGIDLGLKTFAVLSDGARFESQKPLRHGRRKLRRLNRTLARRKKGSKRWWDARNKLGRFHYRVACLRSDFAHKATTQIAESYDLIGIEDLNVAGMVKNRKLAFSISDASWSEFVRQLEYKCEQSGATLVKVNRFFPSSRLCPKCGTINHELTLKDREWVCECGAAHDRDLNAAHNIRDEAVRLNQCPVVATSDKNARGPNVRPALAGSPGGSETARRSGAHIAH